MSNTETRLPIERLRVAQEQVASCVEIYTPFVGRDAAIEAFVSALTEYEAAVREDERHALDVPTVTSFPPAPAPLPLATPAAPVATLTDDPKGQYSAGPDAPILFDDKSHDVQTTHVSVGAETVQNGFVVGNDANGSPVLEESALEAPSMLEVSKGKKSKVVLEPK